ncbi:hypothetical protein BC833DRAFT_617479 [Globomyces pollinis-pini]|nr:hypothetical protein BC833DRAFT_617479 [Globomyces pollinis-pini]
MKVEDYNLYDRPIKESESLGYWLGQFVEEGFVITNKLTIGESNELTIGGSIPISGFDQRLKDLGNYLESIISREIPIASKLLSNLLRYLKTTDKKELQKQRILKMLKDLKLAICKYQEITPGYIDNDFLSSIGIHNSATKNGNDIMLDIGMNNVISRICLDELSSVSVSTVVSTGSVSPPMPPTIMISEPRLAAPPPPPPPPPPSLPPMPIRIPKIVVEHNHKSSERTKQFQTLRLPSKFLQVQDITDTRSRLHKIPRTPSGAPANKIKKSIEDPLTRELNKKFKSALYMNDSEEESDDTDFN